VLFTAENIEELNLLLQFKTAAHDSGIKVHSSARPEVIQACQRLFGKGLVTLIDGGYLTDAGIEALVHVQVVKSLLEAKTQVS
jgi:uncharacterized protein (TIGR02647 family)